MQSSAPSPRRLFFSAPWFAPAIIACIASLAVVAAIDPTGQFPARPAGPGLTVDEPFNVGTGVLMASSVFDGDFAAFRKATGALPDHPPLGRLWIGLWHEATFFLARRNQESFYSIACARLASAAAFGLLVFLVGYATSRWYGHWAGGIAAVSLALMPRTFGHAHLAALETSINLTYCATVLYLAHRWEKPGFSAKPGIWDAQHARTAAIAGVLFGLALLTKIQAVFLPIPVAIWALIVFRQRALIPLVIWGATSFAVFFVGWPWLWEAPLDHLRQYFGRTTDRAAIMVWYLGRAIADHDIPWHYPWVIFLTTIPVGLSVLATWGIFGGERPAWKSPRETLLLACIAFPLLVFSLPGVAVYDGERLFSMVYPLWAVFTGRGAVSALDWLRKRLAEANAKRLLIGFVAAQAVGIITLAPCYLSYYNLLTGGLAGADRLGFQVTYWGDSITRELLTRTAEAVHLNPSADVFLIPELHNLQLQTMADQSPILRSEQVLPQRYSEEHIRELRNSMPSHKLFLVMFLRKEYLPEKFRQPPADAHLVAEVRRQGVQLAALYELP